MKLKLDDIPKMLNKHKYQPKDYVFLDDIEIKIDVQTVDFVESDSKFDTFMFQFGAYNKKTGEYIIGDEYYWFEEHDGNIDAEHRLLNFKSGINSNLELLYNIKCAVMDYLVYE